MGELGLLSWSMAGQTVEPNLSDLENRKTMDQMCLLIGPLLPLPVICLAQPVHGHSECLAEIV